MTEIRVVKKAPGAKPVPPYSHGNVRLTNEIASFTHNQRRQICAGAQVHYGRLIGQPAL